MKYFIIQFLFLSSVAFSQNYYPLDKASSDSQNPTNPVIGCENQTLEQSYFSAQLLTIANKDSLQDYLNTYGSVRLEKGDYNTGTTITMTSNQKLYGDIGITFIDAIDIAAGSTGVVLEQLELGNDNVTFLAGAPITNCTFTALKGGSGGSIIAGNGVQLENNNFFNTRCRINFDMSTSGYARNNTFYRQVVQGWSPQTVRYGNSTTPSYGNVEIGINHLTASTVATDYVNQESVTIIGLDAEGWNQNSTAETDNKAFLYMRGVGQAKIGDMQGGNGYAEFDDSVMTPALDIEADDIIILGKSVQTVETLKPYNSRVIGNTNYFSIKATEQYDAIDFTSTGYAFRNSRDPLEALPDSKTTDNYLNGVLQEALITGAVADSIKSTLLGDVHTPFPRPNWETLPNPLGADWRTERIGQTDSHDYIQNLIDTNGVAELPEGVYYIGSSLHLTSEQGIKGAGTCKTVIVGLTDDFSLIIANDDEDVTFSQKFRVGYLTLQGGLRGIEFDTYAFQVTECIFKYIVFRDQTYGMHLNQGYALDNMYMNNLSFINCEIGFFQDPQLPPPTVAPSDPKNNRAGIFSNTAYVDKVFWYNSQFINCDIAVSMLPHRANNLDTWVNCLFDGNGRAFQIGGRSISVVNCDFKNTTGDCVAYNRGDLSFYNCNFYNNSTTNIFDANAIKAEGCNFNDDVPLLYDSYGYEKAVTLSIMNSTVLGEVGDIGRGLLINTTFAQNPEINYLLVSVGEPTSTKTVLLDDTPTPYPQFLVKY